MPATDTPASTPPYAIVVMGVSGSGKSTFGAVLADWLGGRFIEGDDLHSPENVAKMRSGHPLEDADRWSWLDRVGAALRDAALADGVAVGACSALKRVYRDRLTQAAGLPLSFVFLDVPHRDELTRRLVDRPGHYMPASLLESQLATLERPTEDERAITLDAEQPIDRSCDATVDWIISTSARTKPV